MKGRLQVSAALRRGAAAAVTVAACGGSDSSGSGGGSHEGRRRRHGKLSDKPMTLTFLWFEWPPAHALEELGKEYTKTRPNVTVKVNTVPNPQWHDAIFTQFAARKTNFDMPILDSQNIGEAVENGVDPRPHGLREEEHRHVAVRPVLPRGVRPVPAEHRRARPTRTPRPTACRCSATRGR